MIAQNGDREFLPYVCVTGRVIYRSFFSCFIPCPGTVSSVLYWRFEGLHNVPEAIRFQRSDVTYSTSMQLIPAGSRQIVRIHANGGRLQETFHQVSPISNNERGRSALPHARGNIVGSCVHQVRFTIRECHYALIVPNNDASRLCNDLTHDCSHSCEAK